MYLVISSRFKTGGKMQPKSVTSVLFLSSVLGINLFLAGCSRDSVPTQVAYNESALGNLAAEIAEKQSFANDPDKDPSEKQILLKQIEELKSRLNSKRSGNALGRTNQKILADGMKENTDFYSLKGKYNILVIPVQFEDVKIERPDFYTNTAHPESAYQKLFGHGPNTLRTFYRHQSFGTFDVDGVMAPITTVRGKMEDYGEAVVGQNDKNPTDLVKLALKGVMQSKNNETWWQQFDRWDLNDYDGDGNFYESDGFIDAVVLVYAGKPQSSCQRVFDPKGKRPASKDYPEGPRKKAAVECFNRLWPHRSAIQLPKNDPDHLEKGPIVEGIERPSLNGLKITKGIFALDYNMQAEYSDIATFIHEFGHSLTLPDVYATRSLENSTGAWEVMSSTATQNPQELSSWGRLVLGWLSPKVVTPSQHLSSLYLGSMNYLDPERRDHPHSTHSPDYVTEVVDGKEHVYDILSVVPGSDEAVYRSAVVAMPSTLEAKKVIEFKKENGSYAVYTSHYDGQSRSMKVKFDVPQNTETNANLTLDTVYSIETGTNFESTELPIKITTHFDLATVLINGKEVDRWELLSGDKDQDSLAEENPNCEVDRVKELRLKVFSNKASESEVNELKKKYEICRSPVWISKSYDVSQFRGKTVELEIRYTTDPGFTEMGVVIDNIQLGNRRLDFESEDQHKFAGSFEMVKDGIQNLEHNQYYIFEYRDPQTDFVSTNTGTAHNYDRNIRAGRQSLFLEEGKDSAERFRMIEGRYQPGVLVWYYNSKYDQTSNNPLISDGKGYLLVLNANNKELILPGPWKKAEWLDEEGYYKDEEKDGDFKSFVEKQRMEFVCFSHTEYYKYLEGIDASCENYKDTVDGLRKLKIGTQSILFSREFINEIHPMDYQKYFYMNRPFSLSAAVSTGFSTFRPATSEPFAPFSALKIDPTTGILVNDEEFSKSVDKYAPVSEFSDAKVTLPKNKDHWGDSVNVEKKGFVFEVVEPAAHVVSRYGNRENSQTHDFFERRPRAKIYLQIEPQ